MIRLSIFGIWRKGSCYLWKTNKQHILNIAIPLLASTELKSSTVLQWVSASHCAALMYGLFHEITLYYTMNILFYNYIIWYIITTQVSKYTYTNNINFGSYGPAMESSHVIHVYIRYKRNTARLNYTTIRLIPKTQCDVLKSFSVLWMCKQSGAGCATSYD